MLLTEPFKTNLERNVNVSDILPELCTARIISEEEKALIKNIRGCNANKERLDKLLDMIYHRTTLEKFKYCLRKSTYVHTAYLIVQQERITKMQ